MKRRQLLGFSLLFLAGCAGAVNNPTETGSSGDLGLDRLRFAVTDVLDREKLEADYGPFRETLAGVLGIPVEFVLVDNMSAVASDLQLDRVDLALAGPSEYVQIRARTNAVPAIAITRPNYRSVVVVPEESELQSLADLKGKTLALSDLGSTSGHIGPTAMLLEAGLDPKTDLDVQMLGDEGSVAAIQDGSADAWGGSALDRQEFLPELRLLAEGQPLPSDVFVASSRFDESVVTAIRDRLIENQEVLIEALASGESTQKYLGSTLRPAEDSEYDPIRQAYAAMGEDHFLQP